MEKVSALKRGNWKNNVERDLRGLLDKKGALGAIVTSRNGDVITQLFNKNMPRQKESALMQLVKKAVQAINGMRSSPLRRVVFETEEGAVVLYNADNAIIGCLLEKDYDMLSIMLEIKMVGDLIGSHLSVGELTKEEFERITRKSPDELKVLAYDLVGNITNHFGDNVANDVIRFTLEKNQPRWAAR
ncbi:putative Roadblock/LC7 domain protein [Methanocella conradii HZ254]|uniref:Roadblock/LC7 domain protein n=1 Tax=Methanocella conradii (strain DSM 24694 / JCM 17849 / CGMCC 1.5162 / HZ254) TaxID=1041930 RepID=H8I8T2_METCZ|nr:roadblock/LC7 domain-containing protein [Methanocella conradii]AFC99986.1 putative Roadblock/LC7 domain protein [Methanocella conradii HZ254]MDI6897331.1 roadblock/LC7 domain-containing protein [Methanocella conradii]